MSFTVVIPALNEAKTIASVIRRALEVAERVVVVDDGSTDGTGEVSKNAGASVVRHERPGGYDAAIADGVNEAFRAGAKTVVTCDADGQHRIEDMERVCAPVVAGEADFSAGVRDHYNRPVEAAAGLFSQVLFGTRDPFCGLKCYGRTIYERFGQLPPELNIGTLPMVWAKAAKLRLTFRGIEMQPRLDQPRFGSALHANLKLARAFGRSVKYYAKARAGLGSPPR